MRVRGHGHVAMRAADGAALPEFIGKGERRYEIVREISRGGMGMVHLGRLRGPLGFAKLVAIKTMHTRDVADARVAAMFAAEARVTAGLCHANIVSTLDVLVEAGSVFIVMEYIEGRSLGQLVDTANELGELLPVEVSCAIIHDVLLGLEHAHSSGIIHCDISPPNVLVGVDGLSRILDFGIARIASSAREGGVEEDDTEVRGKVPYMAPEQLRGAAMDHRVDLYAAGATLWELLTGVRLFRGAHPVQIAANVLRGSVPPPSMHAPDVPPELDDFVLRATARDRDLRFHSAREMAAALAAAVPLASREQVLRAMRRIEPNATPASGIRALTAEELAVRNRARARASGSPRPPPTALEPTMPQQVMPDIPPMVVPVIPHVIAPPHPRVPAQAKRTTMSALRRRAATSSLRVRLATIGLLGIALGAAQATFDIVPVGRHLSKAVEVVRSGLVQAGRDPSRH